MMDEALARAVRRIGSAISPEGARATEQLLAPLHPHGTPVDVVIERDLAYGDHERHRLDVFRASGAHPRLVPVVVFVHGGNFVAGGKSAPGSPFYDNVGIWAVRRGFVGATINYRLAPHARYPSGVEDLDAVVRWLRRRVADFGGDPARVVLVGTSAGATHVATYVAATGAAKAGSSPVAGAVLMSGRYELASLAGDAVIATYAGADADLVAISPLRRLAATATPIMAVVAELDPPDHQRQFVQLVAALTDARGQLPPLLRLPRHNHFSEVLHLGTADRSLGDPLASFINGLASSGPAESDDASGHEDVAATFDAITADDSYRGEPMSSPQDAAEHTQRELEALADRYREAYARREPAAVPVAPDVRYTENNVPLGFPDGSWDAVTEELGPALTFSDPRTGGVGIYTAIMMNDTPGFLTVRLRIREGEIVEIEHMLSTKRGVSGPPTPFGDVRALSHQPVIGQILEREERSTREEALALADGYFQTLSRNDGTLHTKFASTCYRIENGYQAAPKGAASDFLLGRYRFNERVRREWLLVDEARGICLARGFIDHKGLMDKYEITDGSMRESPFREPHTWSFLEMFKIKNGEIAAVEATFIGSPYFSRSPWATDAEIQDEDPAWNGAAVLLKDRRAGV